MKSPFIYINKVLLMSVWAALFTACSQIDDEDRLIYVAPAEVNRCVLIEDFTGQRCVKCPNATAAITQLQEQYGHDKVIAVAIHSGPFAHRTTMSSPLLPLGTELGDQYYSHWGIEAQPGVLINRTGGPVYDPSQYASAVNNALQQKSAVDIGIDMTLTAKNLYVTVHPQSANSLDARLQVWLTEDNIVDTQYMPDGSVNREYVHNHVLRQSLTADPLGDNIHIDGEGSLSQSYAKYSAEMDDSWKTKDLNIVAFVYTEKDGVLQAFTARIPSEELAEK